MITNTRLNTNEESKGESKIDKENGVTASSFPANQRVHNLHVVLDANLPDLDQPQNQGGPNIINTKDLGMINAPNIGAEIWDGQIKPKFNQNKGKKKKKKINSKKQSEGYLNRLVSDFEGVRDDRKNHDTHVFDQGRAFGNAT